MGFKTNILSFPKLSNTNQVAELKIKTNAPLNNLTVCTKIAESLLYGVLRQTSARKNFAAVDLHPKLSVNLTTKWDREN